ncbi:hypothetical protein AMATHDRAFT_185387 [Amanita thiersii Skay4041]|uniref:Ino eighty subunit 1 n=1 Tax=Amanita thiersii Skay4041 TaxID=703135 RepID=A0A2A9P1K1_9AGAR|nr:hypothetical protein AMATHDRAFT_185387 [Amanita thiersii Skay4041]
MSRPFVTSSQSHPSHLPPETIPPVGYLSRKALPIKKNDAEPLTRQDVQYDMLDFIFSDKSPAFTSPIPGRTDKVTFCDLYVSALYNSSKCSKVLKDKMLETPAFGIELAKLSLLTNVGRINTTMAFFPEMKTALRTYHPVPSLQKTDGNAQDAPRIKNCLKAALLSSELKGVPPSTPEEIIEKSRAGLRPPTSVVNLIFVLANHASPLSSVHFEGGLNFLDLFLPGRGLASDDRARCFLWTMFYYLEHHEEENPFHDEHSRNHPPKAPRLRPLSEEEKSLENIDTAEEIEWGHKMSAQRNAFLQKLVASLEKDKKDRNYSSQFIAGPSTVPANKSYAMTKRPVPIVESTNSPHSFRPIRPDPIAATSEKVFVNYTTSQTHVDTRREHSTTLSHEVQRDQRTGAHHPESQYVSHSQAPLDYRQQQTGSGTQRERTMLEQAWHSIMTTDPLVDSDEELQDEHARRDYGEIRSLTYINVHPEAHFTRKYAVGKFSSDIRAFQAYQNSRVDCSMNECHKHPFPLLFSERYYTRLCYIRSVALCDVFNTVCRE